MQDLAHAHLKESILLHEAIPPTVGTASIPNQTGIPQILQLRPEERDALRVLFLAPFAPERGSPRPHRHPKVGVRPIYHWEIYRILEELGVLAATCNDLNRLPELAGDSNFVFSLFSRAPFRNCEVYVPAICARLGVALVGAPANVRALAEDKHYAKAIAAQAGIPVVPGVAYGREADIPAEPPMPGPYFVKYRFGSASEDVSLDCATESWDRAADKARQFLAIGKDPVIETLIPGIDITVPVLGGDQPVALTPVAEISTLTHGIATFEQKRFLTADRHRELVRDAAMAEQAQMLARRVAAEMQPFDYMRVDFRFDPERRRLLFMECNIACNLGSTAAIMFSAGHHGISHAAIVEHVLAYSHRRQAATGRAWQTVNV